MLCDWLFGFESFGTDAACGAGVWCRLVILYPVYPRVFVLCPFFSLSMLISVQYVQITDHNVKH